MLFLQMNQTCKVCGEPAAGFHFGAFTCEGCKSFFGRSYNNISTISECKNEGKCIIDKKNRTTCKACRLRKCYNVGMSKGGSRYGRRSNWFKIHCLLQEHEQAAAAAGGKPPSGGGLTDPSASSPVGSPHTPGFGDMAAAAAHLHHHQQQQQQQQQRHPHMSLLGYPSYLPAEHAAAAAALPFFSMMGGVAPHHPQTHPFQLPPHLLFPGYHASAAAAAAAADAAYRQEMYKHRQSVDSAGSVESQNRYSPLATSVPVAAPMHVQSHSARQTPIDVCLQEEDVKSVHSHQSGHLLHPIAIRATPTSPDLSFAAKMQSLSPVSVCSIGGETTTPAPPPATPPRTNANTNSTTSSSSSNTTSSNSTCNSTSTPANAQEGPMDLSMKTSRSSVHSFNDSGSEDQDVEVSAPRRKFYKLEAEYSSSSSSQSPTNTHHHHADVKRQKLGGNGGATAESNHFGGFSVAHNAASAMRGIFVCV
ncbi:hypothetical protein KR009_007426 [Drosophila setifemur]|nr:hypothetical protein KR009_007426 [Drosophila setifemur]